MDIKEAVEYLTDFDESCDCGHCVAMRTIRAKLMETAPSASTNTARDEICAKIIESNSICYYCAVTCSPENHLGKCTHCDNFIGRKLSPVA
jgi:hypothetical protein